MQTPKLRKKSLLFVTISLICAVLAAAVMLYGNHLGSQEPPGDPDMILWLTIGGFVLLALSFVFATFFKRDRARHLDDNNVQARIERANRKKKRG
ncbi:hypothetical protein LJC20_03750 [Eubacteriales bacterium OttesenSCG-928-M02]|nr:hypothetical protein [Eubacteriales bacterium OttesenSCG-928-M02]